MSDLEYALWCYFYSTLALLSFVAAPTAALSWYVHVYLVRRFGKTVPRV